MIFDNNSYNYRYYIGDIVTVDIYVVIVYIIIIKKNDRKFVKCEKH